MKINYISVIWFLNKTIVSGSRKLQLASVLLFFILSQTIQPCTTAVVFGKATDDGRPLLLKNRDADALQNKLVYFFDGKYKFIGLVNSER